jgi:glycosyltransferase involved in cell wall biosynthesis
MLMPWELGHKAWKKLPFFRLFEEPRLRRAAALHCTTEAERDALVRLGLHGHAFIVPNILDLQEFTCLPERGDLRARLGIPQTSPTLLFLGRLHAKKGIEELLSAFLALSKDRPDVHLILAGPDEASYSRRLPEWARGHGIPGNLHLTGELRGEERLQAYRDADAFVSLSQSENFGMSVAEAMAAGLPVVISQGVGLSSWVRASGAGVVASGDAESVGHALGAALDDTAAGGAMGQNARRLVWQELAPDTVGAVMLAAYHRILTGGSVPPPPTPPSRPSIEKESPREGANVHSRD